jgi:hypothetical protein
MGLYSNEKYEEAIPIIKELLNNKYGTLGELSVVYLSYWIADSYKNIENYSQAIDKFNDYLVLINTSTFFSKKQKQKSKSDVLIIIEELKFKLINSKKTEISSDTEIVLNSKAIESKTPLNEIISTQDAEETVTLVVNSQGETLSEAKQKALSDVVDQTVVTVVTVSTGKSRSEAIKFALRDALEQTYGAFISSNTKILNDELVQDEIVSISSGNIVDYEVLSESGLSNSSYSVSVRSRVSLTSFASYMQNKGDEISFSGKSFGMKIKLQKLNARSEEKAIDNMIVVLRDIIKKCVDFEIADISEPVLIDSESSINELYNIKIRVKPTINDNYDSFKMFFLETLKSIAMSDTEIEEYSRINKKIYTLYYIDKNHNEMAKNQTISLSEIKRINTKTKIISFKEYLAINGDETAYTKFPWTVKEISNYYAIPKFFDSSVTPQKDKNYYKFISGVFFKLRSKQSLLKLDYMFQKIQFHVFNYALRYGPNEWSPGKKNNQIGYFKVPSYGLPSLYKNNYGFNNYTTDDWELYENSYRKFIDASREPRNYYYINTASSFIRDKKIYEQRIYDFPLLGYYDDSLVYSEIETPRFIRKTYTDSPELYQTISFKFTLDELEKIDAFKLINLN